MPNALTGQISCPYQGVSNALAARDGAHACACGGTGMPCPSSHRSDKDRPPRLPAGFRRDDEAEMIAPAVKRETEKIGAGSDRP
jgi:hypothetical protein